MTPEEHTAMRQHRLTASRAADLLSGNYKVWNRLARDMRKTPTRTLGRKSGVPSLDWGVENEPLVRAMVWEENPEWDIESVGFQVYRPRQECFRGTQSTNDASTELPLRPTEETWAAVLPGLPRSLYEELAKAESSGRGGSSQNELQGLRQRLQAQGEAPAAAVRALLESGLSDAPPGLRQALECYLALPRVSSRAASGREAILTAHVGASPDGFIPQAGWGYEGKAPFDPEIHDRYLSQNRVPDEYVPQIQFSMWVTGWPGWVFASGDPRRRDHGRLFVTCTKPDLAMHRRFEELSLRFLETYLAGEEFKAVSATAATFTKMFGG